MIEIKPSPDDDGNQVTISGGPYSYSYTLDHLVIHYGHSNGHGSEHTINGTQFPGELQLYAYNSQLYGNWTHAMDKPHGIAAVSVLIQLSNYDHPEENSQLKHMSYTLRSLSLKGRFMPTYEPHSCHH